MNDLRLPLGIFFAILGLLLLTASGQRAEFSDAPVNLYTGCALLGFSGVMLGLAWKALKRRKETEK